MHSDRTAESGQKKAGSRPATLKKQVSAGGVIFRRTDAGPEIVLVSVRGGKIWCLPKGIVDKGETPEVTALREVREETGLEGRIVAPLGEIAYWYFVSSENVKCRKTVSFFLMEYLGGDTSDHDNEVDSADWVPLSEAAQRVSFKGDRTIVDRAIGMLEKGSS